MALFNYANREITAKIVYYGPGVCGKTTSLQYIHERIAPEQRGRLLSLATETDRTIFFDLLPLKLGEIRGFKLRFQLYTVPGQVKYNKTRKLVLQGADAIVFVADSQLDRREKNIESFQNLQENLSEQGKKLEDLPLVYEYNKRDLDNLLSIDELNQDLNSKNLPHFPTVATQGVGVMETLESISRIALQDIEQRLTATTAAETVPTEAEDELTGEGLLDLTGAGEEAADTAFSFSTDELDDLKLESDLDLVETEEKPLESRPIGYDNSIQIEEIEIQPESVAQTGTLKESEFFDLKDIEEQALRELDEFIQGKAGDEPFDVETFVSDADSSTPEAEEETLFSDTTQEDTLLDFSLDDSSAEGGDLDFSFDTGGIGSSESEGEETLEDALEETLEETQVFNAEEDSGLLNFTLDEETDETPAEQPPQEGDSTSDLEPLELSASDLDLSFGEEETRSEGEFPSFTMDEEDTRGESTSLLAEDEDLVGFTLDEELTDLSSEVTPTTAETTANSDIEPLEISEDDLELTFDEDETEETPPVPEMAEFEAEDEQTSEPYDFRITDSVRFEMQHGEEISSVTPFEKQLDELSEDIFTAEEEVPHEEFQPETAEGAKQEQFQAITDENKRLVVLAKYFYQQGEIARAKTTVSQYIQAIMHYALAIETLLKAIALKYETCNPTVASLKIILDSIEEETGNTISGKKSILDNIFTVKNTIQLETTYPDQDSCELASRICERFLSTLAQEFLEVDFSELSPLLPEPAESS